MFKIITSYPNPDTDGVSCMIALNRLYPEFKPFVLGRLSSETRYILDKLGLDEPAEEEKICLNAEEIIIVDTHHRAQLGDDFPYEKVVKVVDHHPAGDDELFPRAEIDNRKIGAAASAVGEEVIECKITDERIIKLLQYAIASNTLNFTAPSTSDFDKDIYRKLQTVSAVTEDEIEEMFRHRTYDSILSDVKYFDYPGGRIAIAQIEQYGAGVDGRDAKMELDRLRAEENLLFSVLNCVDIRSRSSMVIFSDGISDPDASGIFGFEVKDGVYRADRILLRKTDFIPALA